MSDIVDQSAPTKNDGAAIWDLVIGDFKRASIGVDYPDMTVCCDVLCDMRERDVLGFERYGVRLQANNGRNAVVDAYQELLDGAAYTRQAIEEGQANLLPAYNAILLTIAMVREAIK